MSSRFFMREKTSLDQIVETLDKVAKFSPTEDNKSGLEWVLWLNQSVGTLIQAHSIKAEASRAEELEPSKTSSIKF